jgi:metal-dependent amidase/aminoacylase/carboxypeptidase family protein
VIPFPYFSLLHTYSTRVLHPCGKTTGNGLVQTFCAINALRQHIKDGARIHGIITDGGLKPNIVPEHAAACFYVRAPEGDYCDEIVQKLRCCAKGAAKATGATHSFKLTGHSYRALRPNATLADCFRKHIEKLGYTDEVHSGGMGSTDMGDVSWKIPAIHPFIRITEEPTPGHTRAFADAARSTLGRKGMLASAKALAATSIDVLSSQALYNKVKQEFNDRHYGSSP